MPWLHSLGWIICVLTASEPSSGEEFFTPLQRVEQVFEASSEDSDVSYFSFASESLSEPLLERLPPPEDEFAVGLDSTGRVSRQRPLNEMPAGGERSPFKARAFWMPARPVADQPGDFSIQGEEFDLGFPLRIDEDGIWLALGGIQRLDLNTSVVLPDSGLPVPNQLWDIEGGVMHVRQLDDGRQYGGMLRIGSPSDQPFAAVRDLTVTFVGFLSVPAREQDRWSFSLFYSPTGQIIFPIPGVAYVWRPNEQFRANLGIPFSLEYKPTETTVFTASYMPLNNVEVLLRQSWGPSLSIYGGYRTVSETFLLANRENDRERTYLFDQRLTVGVQRELGKNWSVDLSTAYVFDRRFFQAEKFSGTRRDEILIDPGMVATLQFIWSR